LGFRIPKFSNPSDYFLREFYVPFKRTEEDEQKLRKVIDGYQNKLKSINAEQNETSKLNAVDKEMIAEQNEHAGFVASLATIMKRTGKNLFRDPMATRVRIIQTVVMTVLMILVYWDLNYGSRDVYGKVGFAFFVGTNQLMTVTMSICLMFIGERPIFLREYANKTYRILPYFLSKSIIEVPFQFAFPIVLGA
jgi:hypothetical protein